ncbi:MAG TPA: hypothetical protein VGD48_25185 [Kutzneria sp.]
MAWRQRAASGRRSSDAAAGRPVTIPCALRVDGKWRHGKLTLNGELAHWRPRFGTQGSVAVDTAGTVLMDQRDVAPAEVVSLNPGLTVLALNAGAQRVELAILPADLSLAGNAFGF